MLQFFKTVKQIDSNFLGRYIRNSLITATSLTLFYLSIDNIISRNQGNSSTLSGTPSQVFQTSFALATLIVGLWMDQEEHRKQEEAVNLPENTPQPR